MAATVVYKIRLDLSPKQMSRVGFYVAVLLQRIVSSLNTMTNAHVVYPQLSRFPILHLHRS